MIRLLDAPRIKDEALIERNLQLLSKIMAQPTAIGALVIIQHADGHTEWMEFGGTSQAQLSWCFRQFEHKRMHENGEET